MITSYSRVIATLSAVTALAGSACQRTDTPAPTATSARPSGTPAFPVYDPPVDISAMIQGQYCPDPEAEGWRKWTEPETGVGSYIAIHPEKLPKALRWRKAPPDELLPVPSLRSHVLFGRVAGALTGEALQDGSFRLVMHPSCGDYHFLVVANLDGDVQFAMAATWPLSGGKISHGRWAVPLGGRNWPYYGELGRPDADPILLPNQGLGGLRVLTAKYAVFDRALQPWSGGEPVAFDGNSFGVSAAHDDDFFYSPKYIDADDHNALYVWNPARGRYALMGFAGTKIRNVQTDGKHLLWTSLHKDGNFLAATPYATSYAQIKPRRYLTLPKLDATSSTAVGCGHAAATHASDNSREEAVIHIVKLDDGQAWTVASKRPYWSIQAISCTEVLAVQQEFIRIPLSTLPAGTKVEPVPMQRLGEPDLQALGTPSAGPPVTSPPWGP